MPRATAAAAAQTAQTVRDVAAELFGARGVADVSLDDVARAAGVTRGAVYHHYGSKQGLFRAVVAHGQDEVARAVVAAAEGATGPRARLVAGSHAFLDAITGAALVRILLVDGPSVVGWEEWRRLDAEGAGAHLRDALRDAGVAEDLLEATTAQLSGAMNEAALWVAQHEDPVSARDRAHTVLDAVLGSVAPVG